MEIMFLENYLNPYTWHLSFKIAGSIIVGIFSLIQAKKYFKHRKMKERRKKWNSVEKDVVVLHQFRRGKFCPNLSPFALKIETYLRLANIKYIVDIDEPFGPNRKKCPWITLNGEEIEDSEFVKHKLKKHFSVHFDDHLSEREKALLEGARIIADEHIFWCVITYRYFHDKCKIFLTSQNFSWFLNHVFPILMVTSIGKKSKWHGIGNFTPDELFVIFQEDCQTLSHILGDDDFFGGKDPSSADCSIFGGLAQIMWNAPKTRYEQVLMETYPNLGNYCNTMKNRVYPDWNQLLDTPM